MKQMQVIGETPTEREYEVPYRKNENGIRINHGNMICLSIIWDFFLKIVTFRQYKKSAWPGLMSINEGKIGVFNPL